MGKGIGKMSVAFKQRAVPFAIKYATYAKDMVKYNFNRAFSTGGDLALTRYLNSGPMALGSGPLTESYLSRMYGSAGNVFASKRAELARWFGASPTPNHNADRLLLLNPQERNLIHQLSNTPTTEAGWLGVVLHGTDDGLGFSNGLTAKGLADIIQQSGKWTEGQSIELLSCSSGRLPNGVAQELSEIMNVGVKAPSNLLWPHGSAGFKIHSRFGQDVGSWIMFPVK